jgi:hypothetical protein
MSCLRIQSKTITAPSAALSLAAVAAAAVRGGNRKNHQIFAGLQLAAVCAMAIALATPPMAHAQSACDPPPTGTMVAWYPFDELAGPTSANLATQNTGVWTSVPWPTPVPGEVAGGLKFNGSNYIDTPDSIVTNFGPAGAATCGGGDYSTCQGDFSVDVWVNIPVLPNGNPEVIVDKRDATPIGYSFYLYGNTFYSPYAWLGLQMGDSTGFANYGSPFLAGLKKGTWHLVAVTVKRTGKITWYLDGAAKGTSVPTQMGSLVNKVPLRIGANSPAWGGAYFNGSMDELEMFNRVLTAAEIKAIYAAGLNGKCKP